MLQLQHYKNIFALQHLDRSDSAATISQMYITGGVSTILATDGRNKKSLSGKSRILSVFPSLKGVVREEQAAESTSERYENLRNLCKTAGFPVKSHPASN